MMILSIFIAFLSGPAWAVPIPVEMPWEKISSDDGIQVWQRDIEGSPIVSFRGETVVDAPIAKIAQVLIDTSRKKEWVAHLAEAKNIRDINDYERIEYNHTEAPFIVSDRDFVFYAKADLNKQQRQMIIHIKSITDPSMPERNGIVRGQLMNSNYTLTSLTNREKTRVSVEIQADPMGLIPKWIANFFQRSWPRKTLEGIRNQVAKADVIEHPGVKKFFEILE